MTDRDHALQNVIGTMALEGIELTETDIKDVRAIIAGEHDGEAAIAEIRARYTALAKSDDRKAAASIGLRGAL